MAWISKYTISGGMYGGYTCPTGSLSELLALSSSIIPSGNAIKGSGSKRSSQQGYTAWPGAYGMDGGLLESYIRDHADSQQHEFVLAEMPIENQTGAQYYKQSLVLYVSTYAYERVIAATRPDDSDLHMIYYEITIKRFVRREYPAPYSAYTETTIIDMAGTLSGYFYISGTRELGGFAYSLTDDLYIPAGTFEYDNTDYFGFAIYQKFTRCDNYDYGWQSLVIGCKDSYLDTVFGSFEPEETDDPNEEPDEPGGGGSSEGGGEGSHDKHQDPVPYPDDPPIGGASGGFVTLYRCTVGEMQRFAKKMFEFDVMQALKNIFADPMDMIAGVMIVPFRPDTSGVARPVVHMPSPVPDIAWDDWYNVITDQYQDIDCGSLYIDKYYDSCFDFNPYTRLLLYLPYLGYKELDPDEVMGHTIQVKYKVDCMTGDCVAFVMRTVFNGIIPCTQCIAQFSGNCGVRVAFGRASFDSAIAASIQLITGIATGAIKGAGGAISAFMAGAAGKGGSDEGDTIAQGQLASGAGAASAGISMPTVQQMKTQTIKSGVMGANAGFISVQKPHIIKFIPNQSRPDNYRHMHGYPANMPGPISSGYSGYMELDIIELDGIIATDTEKNEIAALCKGGVIYGES